MPASSARPSSPSAEPPITSASRSSVAARSPRAGGDEGQHRARRPRRVRPAPLVKAPDSSLRPSPSSSAHARPGPAGRACRRRAAPPASGPRSATPAAVSRPLSSLRLLIFSTAAPAGRPAASKPCHRHGDDLGVGLGPGRAHGVGVALDELAVAAGAGLLVAPDRAEGVAAERLGQGLPVLGGEAGQRRGQVVAQRHPLLVVVLQGEDALVGPVGVGQELAERVGVFEGAGVQRLEAVALIDRRHGGQDPPLGGEVAGAAVDEAARRAGFGAGGVGHGVRA